MSTFSLFPEDPRIELQVTLDWSKQQITFDWKQIDLEKKLGHGAVWVTGDLLRWRITGSGETDDYCSPIDPVAVEYNLKYLAERFPVAKRDVSVFGRRFNFILNRWERVPIKKVGQTWQFLAELILEMGQQLAGADPTSISPEPLLDPESVHQAEKRARREEKQRLQQEMIQSRVAEANRRNRERQVAPQRPAPKTSELAPAVTKPVLPVPDVEIRTAPARLPVRDLFDVHSGTDGFLQIERASLMWVSNQSDDLLALPYCTIDHLEYQIRSALRVTGSLRGRALLSDEVGLGKTVEAGLVLKEYVTRGLVRRFLVLTVPSLIDQWAEELETKFSLRCVTTNESDFRVDPERFWTKENALIASLHTFKQENHLASALRQPWDMVIVDEAHYLRNQSSKAWQAVNSLQRQFILLLTATPVQNSLEDLYNLVTLLRPGHLPPPKEFRQRFINRDRPYEPREPEQLRQLLGQVMIRNTRANAGIRLPSRRAETVLYEPESEERNFWEEWDNGLRTALRAMPPGQASLWGRLLLQAAGSSPLAWLDALDKFPDRQLAAHWKTRAPLTQSWQRKIAVLPPMTQTSGGVVIFSQFLATQKALAEALTATGTKTWVLNGQVPAADRQSIVDRFRDQGGALLLTRSGTEGRNLQFCHRLVNFDLPWNPMEIEQRIGRLHRIGQQQIVEIYNLVQSGTLQAHLLELLQDKLNLFDLVVGEAGLILGERFSSDDFEAEVFRRWQESPGDIAGTFKTLGEELSRDRAEFDEIKRLDETLFGHDYESI
ncbi:MAG: DEAD/DEAH box helicase [Verrucomicrobia bacterium]|nr:DEAD/DEAH box helicase [Verrucomicrobiota bacterium]